MAELSLFAYVGALAFAMCIGATPSPAASFEMTWSANISPPFRHPRHHDFTIPFFFWQASQEARISASIPPSKPLIEKHYGAQKEFHRIRADTIVGMAFPKLIACRL